MKNFQEFTGLYSQFTSYDLARVLVGESKKMFELENSSFFLWKSSNSEYVPRYQEGIDDLGDWLFSFNNLDTENPVVKFLAQEKKYVAGKTFLQNSEAQKAMQEIGAVVSFPLFAHNKLRAIFNLGPKINKKPFTVPEIAWVEKQVKLTEQRLAFTVLLEERAVFSAVTAHDLHQPLKFVIPSNLDELISGKAGPLNERQKELVVELQAEFEQLEKGFARLFDLSFFYLKMIGSKQHWEKFDFIASLEEVNKFFREKIQSKGLTYELQLPEDEIQIFGDRENLTAMVSQLLDNAAKFTTQGRISLAVRKIAEGLELEIKDTGCGIEEDYLAGLLERPFLQMEKLSAGHWPGTGLAKVKEILGLHQGQITIDSKPRQGTTVRIIIPK